jgi:hypothetical protein
MWQLPQVVGNWFARWFDDGVVVAAFWSPRWQVSHLAPVPPTAWWSIAVPGPHEVKDLWQLSQVVGNLLVTCREAGVVIALARSSWWQPTQFGGDGSVA